METPESPASATTPVAPDIMARRLREGVNGTAVTSKAGVALIIVPARASSGEILSGQSSELLRYAELAQTTRDQYIISSRGNKDAIDDADWYDLLVLALTIAYEITADEIATLTWLDMTNDVLAIAAAAWGNGSIDKSRKRALALACAGLGDVPLSAIENAFLADWAWNSKRSPQIKES